MAPRGRRQLACSCDRSGRHRFDAANTNILFDANFMPNGLEILVLPMDRNPPLRHFFIQAEAM
jgi:hypothetical protein